MQHARLPSGVLHTHDGVDGPPFGLDDRLVRGDRELDLIAAHQHGVVTRAQARECGYSPNVIQSKVAKGEWIPLDDGVYVFRSTPQTWEGSLQGALLSRPIALVAGRSAAVLHGLPGYGRGKPEILIPFQGNARSSVARVIRSRHFDRVEHTTAGGFPVTTIAETILTLSFRESRSRIERIVDDQLAARKLHIEEFDPILDRLEKARMRGLPGLRRIVAERDAGAYQPPTSVLERHLYRLLDDERLPGYERQSPLPLLSGRAFVDAFIPAWRLVVEADGRRWHTRSEDFENDRRRGNEAAMAGLITIRFSYPMLKDEPLQCIETLVQTGRWRRPA